MEPQPHPMCPRSRPHHARRFQLRLDHRCSRRYHRRRPQTGLQRCLQPPARRPRCQIRRHPGFEARSRRSACSSRLQRTRVPSKPAASNAAASLGTSTSPLARNSGSTAVCSYLACSRLQPGLGREPHLIGDNRSATCQSRPGRDPDKTLNVRARHCCGNQRSAGLLGPSRPLYMLVAVRQRPREQV